MQSLLRNNFYETMVLEEDSRTVDMVLRSAVIGRLLA